MTAPMTLDGLPAACYERWTPSGFFWRSTGWTPRTIGRNGPCALGCSGASARWARPVTRAIGWVERILSLKETCRLQARATYAVLVDAMTSFFQGQQPDLSWLNAEVSPAPHPL